MFAKPTFCEGLISDADHYAEAARAQRKRAGRAQTPAVRAECIARAILFEDKARDCRKKAAAIKSRKPKRPVNDWPEIKF